MSKLIMWLYVVLLLIIGVTLSVHNRAVVFVDLIFLAGEVKLAFVMLASFGLGALLGIAVMIPPLWRQQRNLRRVKREQQRANTNASVVSAAQLPVGASHGAA